MTEHFSSKAGRRLRRFFSSEPLQSVGQSIQLSIPESRHLREVLRLQKGDLCFVTDGLGRSAKAKIEGAASGGEARLIVEELMAAKKPALSLRFYPALLQKGKMDYLIEKAQELGVRELTPLETEHTVLKINQSAKEKVMLRWKRIAQEAAKQSGSPILVSLQPPRPFLKALENIPENEQAVLFHPSGDAENFRDWVRGISSAGPLHLFLGPEGGFSRGEVLAFRQSRGKRAIVKLGDTILKADTAFVGAAASLRFLFS